MSIYSAKIALEAGVSPDNVIQTPGEVGNDLNEIEKAIAGPDGLEANREEIENAETGLIGDPIEEAYAAIYESEYNYNMIMHTIGINEMKAASIGRDLVLEAADKEGFFEKVKQWLKTAFANIVKVFKAAIAKISSAIHNDKTFAEKNKDAILEGAKGEWKAKGFIFKDKIEFDTEKYKANDWATPAKHAIDDVVKGGGQGPSLDPKTFERIVLDKVAKGADSIKDANEALYKELRGGDKEPVDISGKISGEDVFKILTGDNEKKAIKEAYDKVKTSFEASLKDVEALRKEITEAKKDENPRNTAPEFAVCEFYTRAIKFEKQVQNMVYANLIKAASAKRAQARKLAVSFISNYKKPKEDPAAAPVGESGSIFGSLKFM